MTGENVIIREPVHGKLPLGAVVATRGAVATLTNDEMSFALQRHHSGDWGLVCTDDWKLNDESLEAGERILSSYDSSSGERFWIITEWDRSCTTILLPDEY